MADPANKFFAIPRLFGARMAPDCRSVVRCSARFAQAKINSGLPSQGWSIDRR
jgi:hypothetical protein